MNDTNGDDGLYPRVNTEPRVHNLTTNIRGNAHISDLDALSREELALSQYDGDRNLYSALGYIQTPEYRHYRARYERTDEATALIDKIAKKAWATPEIHDTADREEDTDFESDVNSFIEGDNTRDDPIAVAQRATRFERLGQFALIFLGISDANVEDGDHTDLQQDVAADSVDSVDDINYLVPYDEGRIDINETDIVTDPASADFGRPEVYDVDLGDIRGDTTIHQSRVLHIVGDIFDDPLRSPSVLKQSLNRIDDIEKIKGGSAEAYWRAAYQGLVVSPPEGQTGPMGGSLEKAGGELHDQIKRYKHNLQRTIFTSADVNPLDSTIADPTPHLESQYRSIAAGHDIPQSILMGNETGERATEEDRRMWHERIAEYRTEFCEPRVLRPLIDHLRELGILPDPVGDGYRVEWPPLDEPTEQERAETANEKAQALKRASGGQPDLLAEVGEIRTEVFGWGSERGSEVEGETMEPVTTNELQESTNGLDEDELAAELDQLEKWGEVEP